MATEDIVHSYNKGKKKNRLLTLQKNFARSPELVKYQNEPQVKLLIEEKRRQ